MWDTLEVTHKGTNEIKRAKRSVKQEGKESRIKKKPICV